MDLEEWEILSNEDHDNISPKFILKNTNTSIINTDYFQETSDHQFDDQDIISKDFFVNKSLENQFVDMKMDSPKSLNRVIDQEFEKMIVYEEKKVKDDQKEVKDGKFEVKEQEEGEKMVDYEESKVKIEEDLSDKLLNSCMGLDCVDKKKDGENGGVNIWKWAMSGMGALVTFGFTAVTISLVVLSNQHKDGNNSKKQQDLHFQIFSHDKRFKQVVRRAKRLNEAISVMRGAPLATAHITIGGYHEGL